METMTLSGCTIAFDLDGTLADTAPDLHTALNKVLAAEGLPAATLEDVRAFVGQGARTLIIRAFGVHGVYPDERRVDALTEEYIRVYATDISSRSAAWPGVVEVLEKMERWGAKLCVCTNKRTDLSVQLLNALGLSRYFAAVIGADSVKNRKPH